MGYTLLFSAIIFIVVQFSLTKIYQKNVRQCLITSMFFVLLSSIVKVVIFVIYNKFKPLEFTTYTTVLAFILAVLMVFYNVLGIKIMSLGNLSIYSLFMMLGGMILPFVEGLIIQPEYNKLTVCNLLGIILLPLFLILQVVVSLKSEKKDKTENKNSVLFYVLCIVIFFVNGLTSINSSLQSNPVNNYKASDPTSYTILSGIFLVAMSLVVIAVMLTKKDNRELMKSVLNIKTILLGILVSIVSAISSFCILLSNGMVPTVVVYPIISGGVIVLSAIVSALVFKEKQKKFDVVCYVLSALATILFIF